MRKETLASYLTSCYKSLKKYLVQPLDIETNPNMFWYCPSLVVVTNGKNWINSSLSNMDIAKPTEVFNYGVITLDVTLDILEAGNNHLIYECTYMGIKVKPDNIASNNLVPFSTYKNRKYKGISFAFPNLTEHDYIAIISENWHIGLYKFRNQTTFNIIVRKSNKSRISNLNRIIVLQRFLASETSKPLVTDESNISIIDKNVKFSSVADNYDIGIQSFTWPSRPNRQGIRLDPVAGIAYLSSIGCNKKDIKSSLNMITQTSKDLNEKWIKCQNFMLDSELNQDFLCANLRVKNPALGNPSLNSQIVQFTYPANTTIRNLSPFEVIALEKYSYALKFYVERPSADLIQSGLTMELPKIN